MNQIKPHLTRAIIGGFIGTLIFTLMGQIMAPKIIGQPMDVAKLMAPMLGGSYYLAVAMHFILGSILFPVMYLLTGFTKFPGPGWIRGALFLIIMYLIAMTVVMPALGYGLFFDSPPKAMIALMGHVVFGLVMGAIIGKPDSN